MSRQQRPPMKKAAAAGTLLNQFLQQSGLAGKLRAYESWRVWNEVVGPQIAAHAQPAKIRDGVLDVRVDQAVWMQQLQLMKPKILARLNERLGGEVFRDIFWRRGRVEHPPVTAEELSHAPFPPLPAEEIARIGEIVALLDDAELRRQLQQILVRQAQLDLARSKD
jgi:hypothetical protein